MDVVANRLKRLPVFLFVEISRKIAQKRAEGADVITFGIGDPDIATPPSILNHLSKASLEPSNHRYPDPEGLLEFRQAVSTWYKTRFGVVLNPANEIISLIGAKEGIGHAAFGLVNPGDIVLQPEPAYPAYNSGTILADGEPYWMPLKEENNWLPDLAIIPEQVAQRAKVMWLNYPNNPTGAVAPFAYLKRVVEYCKENEITLLHDACYTEISFDQYQPLSLLEIPGAKDIAVEFHSLSKSYNMTGWRIGMAAGNADVIQTLFEVKSNLDSGVPQAIQRMAIEALTGPQDYICERNKVYQARRDKLVPVLADLGLRIQSPVAGLYIWAGIPQGYSSAEYATLLLDELDMVVTPGSGYGPSGEGYLRFSLTLSDDDLDKAITRLQGWKRNP
jgi:LL-diaminopimelate aminotransferase